MKEVLSNKLDNTITIELIDEKTGKVEETITKNIVTKAGKAMLHHFLSNQMGAMFRNELNNFYYKESASFPDEDVNNYDDRDYHKNFPIGSIVLSSNATPIDDQNDHIPPEVLQYIDNPDSAPTFEEQIIGWLDFFDPSTATADVKKGVLNRAESEITNNSIKFVIDFATSEANGEINSIMIRTGRGSELSRTFDQLGSTTHDLMDFPFYLKSLGAVPYIYQDRINGMGYFAFNTVDEFINEFLKNDSYFDYQSFTNGNLEPSTDYDIESITYDATSKILYMLTIRYYGGTYYEHIDAIDMTDPQNPVDLGYTSLNVSSLNGVVDSNSHQLERACNLHFNNNTNKLYFAYNTHIENNSDNEFRVIEIDDTDPTNLVFLDDAPVLVETGHHFGSTYAVEFGSEIYWQSGKEGTLGAFSSKGNFIWKFDFETLTTQVVHGPLPEPLNYYAPTMPVIKDEQGEPLITMGYNGQLQNVLFDWGNLTRAVLPNPVTKLNTQTMKVTYELKFL